MFPSELVVHFGQGGYHEGEAYCGMGSFYRVDSQILNCQGNHVAIYPIPLVVLSIGHHLNLLNPASQLLVQVDIVQPCPNLSKGQNVIPIR